MKSHKGVTGVIFHLKSPQTDSVSFPRGGIITGLEEGKIIVQNLTTQERVLKPSDLGMGLIG